MKKISAVHGAARNLPVFRLCYWIADHSPSGLLSSGLGAAPGPEVYYAVMPYPICAGCLGGMNASNALTGTNSHELCEATTDPVGNGWYDNPNNAEIGDLCAWNFKQVSGYTVQLEWSNQQNKCL